MAAVFRHGLYYTGDKAYRDEDGYIWFVGRDDDVIKASDYRIGPFEVESILLEHDAVLESAVVGSPHPVRGHEVKAFLILAEGHAPSEALSAELFDRPPPAGSVQGAAHHRIRHRVAQDRERQDPARGTARSGSRSTRPQSDRRTRVLPRAKLTADPLGVPMAPVPATDRRRGRIRAPAAP